MAQFFLTWVVFRLFQLMPLKVSSFISWKLFQLAGLIVPKMKRRINDNIDLVMPDLEKSERNKIIKGVFENFGRSIGEMPVIHRFSDEQLSNILDVHNFDLFKKHEKTGCIVLLLHLGNWEPMCRKMVLENLNIKHIYRKQNNRYISKMILNIRGGEDKQISKNPDDLRRLVKALREKSNISSFFDLKGGIDNGVICDFLGVPAITSTFPIEMHKKYGYELLLCYNIRNRSNKLKFDMYLEEIHLDQVEKSDDHSKETQYINNIISEKIKQNTDQWFWFHRRWKR